MHRKILSLGCFLSFLFLLNSCKIDKKEASNEQTIAQTPSTISTEQESTIKTLPQISGTNHNGEYIDIKNIKAKYILVEFWASWCPPCRENNPTLVEIYKEFHPKGFEILSISLDKEEGLWKQAIMQDSLNWKNHICDLKWWNSPFVTQFGIEEIPNGMLMDMNGNIVASHIHPKKLRETLSQLLK